MASNSDQEEHLPYAKRYLRLTTWHEYIPPDDKLQFDWEPCTCKDCKEKTSGSVPAFTIDGSGIQTINPWVDQFLDPELPDVDIVFCSAGPSFDPSFRWPRIHGFYWETTIHPFFSTRAIMSVGFAFAQCPTIHEHIWVSDTRSPGNWGHFAAGDTVGCGLMRYKGSFMIFYTLNGTYMNDKHIKWNVEYLTVHPAMTLYMHPHAFVNANINFGSKPFLFDIEGHFHSWHKKTRQMAHDLPIEIMLMVFHHLGQYKEDEQDSYKSNIQNMSRVCHTLHRIFQPKLLNPLVILHQHELKGIVKCLTKDSFKSTTVLIVSSSNNWSPVSCLLPPFAQNFSSLNEIKFNGNYDQNFDALCSAVQRQTLPIFIRIHFNHVTSLTLEDFKFSTWCKFAQIICAFPQLEKLKLSHINWDDNPQYPPRWLKTSCCISHIVSYIGNDYGPLWLCLLSTSQRASPFTIISEPFQLKSVDAYLIAEIAKHLFSIIPDTGGMDCNIHVIDEQTKFKIIKGEYSIKYHDSNNKIHEWHLKFEKSILGHELVELSIYRYCSPPNDIPEQYLGNLKTLNKLISRLSNSATCKCLINFVSEESLDFPAIQHLSAHRQSLHLLEFCMFEERVIKDSNGKQLRVYEEYDDKLLAEVDLDESEESEDEDESEAS